MATSGIFYNYPIPDHEFGLYCTWESTPHQRLNKTEVTINVYLRYDSMVTESHDIYMSIGDNTHADSTPVIDDPEESSEWKNYKIGTYTVFVPQLQDGTGDEITIAVNFGFNDTYAEEFIESIIAEDTITLDDIETYTISIEQGDNSYILATRTSSSASSTGELSDGDIIYYGDRIRIDFSSDEHYEVDLHQVNGVDFVNGGTVIVDSDIDIESSAKPYITEFFFPDSIRCFDEEGNPVKEFYQWDKGVVVVVKDLALSPTPTFQFTNFCRQFSIEVTPEVVGDDLHVLIPDSLFERPDTIFAYIYQSASDPNRLRTVGSIYLPVRARIKPQTE